MTPDVTTALKAVLDRLQAVAASDAELRARLRDLVRSLLVLAEEPAAAEPPPVIEAPPPTVVVAPPPAPVIPPKPSPPPIVYLSQPREPEPPSRPPEPPPFFAAPVADEELPLIEARCRLKAEATRWLAERRRLLKRPPDAGGEDDPQYHAFIAQAKELPDCFLWMFRLGEPDPRDLPRYDQLATCFEAASAAAGLLAAVVQGQATLDILEKALYIGAEAQSALRVAVNAVHDDYDSDGDQRRLFRWVRSTATSSRLWVDRYMQKEDPADPGRAAALLERARQLGESVHHFRDRERRHKKTFNKIRYLVNRVRGAAGEEQVAQGQSLIEAVTGLVQDGVPPSNAELRDLLLPVLDELPDDPEPPKPFQLVLREIDRYLALRPAKAEGTVAEAPTPEVRRVAELLRGRKVVLIGGVPRPAAGEALTNSLGLKELVWIEGRDQTYTSFEPDVADPDVAVVVLAIRWSRHGFGEVKEFCEKYAKPLVRLPGGYNPNQVAFHIISQVGERLAATAGKIPLAS